MANPSIDRIFTYHAPFGDQPQRYEAIRGLAKALGKLYEDSCPPSRERSLAITHLQQSVQMANASIAINEVKPLVDDSLEARVARGELLSDRENDELMAQRATANPPGYGAAV